MCVVFFDKIILLQNKKYYLQQQKRLEGNYLTLHTGGLINSRNYICHF